MFLLDFAKQPHAEGSSMRSVGMDGGAWAEIGHCRTATIETGRRTHCQVRQFGG